VKKWHKMTIVMILWCVLFPLWVRTDCVNCCLLPGIDSTVIIFITGGLFGFSIIPALILWEEFIG
jgi:hypothetical protein